MLVVLLLLVAVFDAREFVDEEVDKLLHVFEFIFKSALLGWLVLADASRGERELPSFEKVGWLRQLEVIEQLYPCHGVIQLHHRRRVLQVPELPQNIAGMMDVLVLVTKRFINCRYSG